MKITFNKILGSITLVLLLIAIYVTVTHKEKEIACEIKRFEYVKEDEWFVTYKLKAKMVRQFPKSLCKTDNALNTEWIISRGPVIILSPFREGVQLPKTNKKFFLEE